MKRIIIFLIRKRLGLKKGQRFRFSNQREMKDYYYFTEDALMKHCHFFNMTVHSNVSLNWLLDDKCEIDIGEGYECTI